MVWVIVVAAGTGSRFGSAKQDERLGTVRVVDHAVAAARGPAGDRRVVLVVRPDRVHDHDAAADVVVAGGASRSASVRAGLAAVPADATIVVVHDAARPLAGEALFAAVVAALDDSTVDAAIPGVPVTDTIKQVGGSHRVVATLDRSHLVAVQTPQAFRAEALRSAHRGEADATDDAALVEAEGGGVVVVPGDARNRKITTPDDLDWARAELARRLAQPAR